LGSISRAQFFPGLASSPSIAIALNYPELARNPGFGSMHGGDGINDRLGRLQLPKISGPSAEHGKFGRNALQLRYAMGHPTLPL
jgi:hypothetical protein